MRTVLITTTESAARRIQNREEIAKSFNTPTDFRFISEADLATLTREEIHEFLAYTGRGDEDHQDTTDALDRLVFTQRGDYSEIVEGDFEIVEDNVPDGKFLYLVKG